MFESLFCNAMGGGMGWGGIPSNICAQQKTKLSSGYGEVSDKLNIEQPLKYGREAIKRNCEILDIFHH